MLNNEITVNKYLNNIESLNHRFFKEKKIDMCFLYLLQTEQIMKVFLLLEVHISV